MLSVAGLERAKLDPLCREAASKEALPPCVPLPLYACVFFSMSVLWQDGGVCSVANCLFPQGFSIGGTEKAQLKVGIATSQSLECCGAKAINMLKELAEKNGALQARTKGSSSMKFALSTSCFLQAKVLKTAGAFHTSLMQPAQDVGGGGGCPVPSKPCFRV